MGECKSSPVSSLRKGNLEPMYHKYRVVHMGIVYATRAISPIHAILDVIPERPLYFEVTSNQPFTYLLWLNPMVEAWGTATVTEIP